MNDPYQELRDYLETLSYKTIYLKSILKQINKLNKWKQEGDQDALNIGMHFFKAFQYSAHRNLTIELNMILSKNEEKNIFDWLDKAYKHAIPLKPMVDGEGFDDERELANIDSYRDQIDQHKMDLEAHRSIISNIKNLRDSGFTHADSKYFHNPSQLSRDFPVTWKQYNEILDTISKIIHIQYGYLFGTHLVMELTTSGHVDVVLKYIRAFQRIRNHPELKYNRNLNLRHFFSDDYDPNIISL